MNNETILETLEITAKLLELHDANEWKIRAVQSAIYSLDKTEIGQAPTADLPKLLGKSIAGTIEELIATGQSSELNKLLSETPEGVLEMFKIKGIGPKKIKHIWREMGLTDTRELLLACENGEIAKQKGFGEKTQEGIKTSLLFLQTNAAKLRMNTALFLAEELKNWLSGHYDQVAIVGDVARKNEIVEEIALLVGTPDPLAMLARLREAGFLLTDETQSSPFVWRGKFQDRQVPVSVRSVESERFINEKIAYSSGREFLNQKVNQKNLFVHLKEQNFITEEAFFSVIERPYLAPELRENSIDIQPEKLITWDGLRGTLHNHSTYSDGKHTLEVMARAAAELGLTYLGIADHSKTAAYANGLSEERVAAQHKEVDVLNAKFVSEGLNFKIFKGIESDILGDGSLDYAPEILKTFDFVVASVHSNLTMTEEKAMSRLLRAIENPYTTILGHPTGRLLLARNGYPVNHKFLIDACAANGVVIELNASPYRLDIDWRWIPYCIEKGVMVSINPDAHETAGYADMHYGVAVARKGGLTTDMTFNALTMGQMQDYFQKK